MDNMPDSIAELIHYFDSESDRFWMRFHIFTALQIGSIIAFAKVAEVLKSRRLRPARPVVFRFLLLFMTVFSFVGAVAITRGCDLELALTKAIEDEYNRLPEASGPNVHLEVAGHSYFRGEVATTTASLFSWLCAMLWPGTWFIVRKRGFTIDAPPAANDATAETRISGRTLIIAAMLGTLLFVLIFRVLLPSSIATFLSLAIVVTVVLTGFACVSVHVVSEVPFALRLLRASFRADEAEERQSVRADGTDENGTNRP